MLVHIWCAPTWRFHTELYKFLRNISTNICGSGERTDLKLGEVSSLFIFNRITISWLYPLNGFRFISLLRDSENDLLNLWPLNFDLCPVTCILQFLAILFNMLMLMSAVKNCWGERQADTGYTNFVNEHTCSTVLNDVSQSWPVAYSSVTFQREVYIFLCNSPGQPVY